MPAAALSATAITVSCNAGLPVPVRTARISLTAAGLPRAVRCVSLAACALLLGNQGLQTAAANGDTRTISFRHLHTGEKVTITYKREGRYDDAGLKQINHVLRDWRRNEEIRMDPRVIDIIWDVNREVGGKEAIEIISAYRAPATNQMLRRRSRGVAQASLHTLGKAVDFAIPGVPLEAIRNAGLRLQRGGVGFYPTSGSPFVHLDVGGVRHWPRMTHDQLARVFPNGRTVHVPSNGRPLSGYALALADVQKRGGAPSQTSLAAAQNAGIETTEKPKRNLLAALFGGGKEEDEDNEAVATPASSSTPSAATAGPRIRSAAAALVPLPMARPVIRETAKEPAKPARSGTFALASAESQPIDLTAPAPAQETKAATDVFSARGLWEGPQGRPEPPASIPDPRPVQVASADPDVPAHMRVEPRPADLDMTGALTPWPNNRTGADRVPTELALAYAAQNDGMIATPVTKATPPMGAAVARSVAPAAALDNDGLTTIIKKTIARGVSPRPAVALPSPVVTTEQRRPLIAAGSTYEDPWLRAMVLAPDLQNYLTITAFEPPDPQSLRPLMFKPESAVVMTFSPDPHLGMTSERFSGTAVVFVSTVTFVGRTAMLR